MHALLVTFRPQAPEAEIEGSFGPKMMATIPATKGLIMKTLMASGPDRWGSFYLFDTPAAAEGYLSGSFFTEFRSSPMLSDFEIQHFEVDDHPSAAFGTPSLPLASAASAAAAS